MPKGSSRSGTRSKPTSSTRGRSAPRWRSWSTGGPVVDLWGGLADAHTERAWSRDTPVLVYSATKGPTATCALLLWERGLLDLDAPVAEVWPEFAAGGKEAVTTRHLLTHQAGLPVFDEPITFTECHDPDLVAARLAAQTPPLGAGDGPRLPPAHLGLAGRGGRPPGVGPDGRRHGVRLRPGPVGGAATGAGGVGGPAGGRPVRPVGHEPRRPRPDLPGRHHGRRVADLQSLRQPSGPARRRVVQRSRAAPGRVAGGQRHRHRPGAGHAVRRAGARPHPVAGDPRRGLPPPGVRAGQGAGRRDLVRPRVLPALGDECRIPPAAPSATRAPAARWPSPTARRGSASPTS